MRNQTCCFTGHRILPASDYSTVWDRTAAAVRAAVARGVRYFGVGGAIGYDTLAAKVLFQLRATEFPHIKVILVYPFDGFTRSWSHAQQHTYSSLYPQYDKVVRISDYGGREAYLARDRHLVDGSGLCICYLKHGHSGTAYTVQYAQETGCEIWNTAADNSWPEEYP